MNDDAKRRIVQAVDALGKQGVAADTLSLHPATAQEIGVHATHVDLGSEDLFRDAASVAAELTHPDYDKPRFAGERKLGGEGPKSAEEAARLAKAADTSHLRRPRVVLAVKLDPQAPAGKLFVTGQPVERKSVEV